MHRHVPKPQYAAAAAAAATVAAAAAAGGGWGLSSALDGVDSARRNDGAEDAVKIANIVIHIYLHFQYTGALDGVGGARAGGAGGAAGVL
jgi:hypothetical protein